MAGTTVAREVDPRRALALRLTRSGLSARVADPVEAARRPLQDLSADAALLALGARVEDLDRDGFDARLDDGRLACAHVVRGAIHVVDPEAEGRFGRALLARDDDELAAQLGRAALGQLAEAGIPASEALAEVAAAIVDALAGDAALDRTALHAALRERVREALLPWCRGCESRHVAPMVWRWGTVVAGARLDARRRYRRPAAPADPPPAIEAARAFLRWYGPTTRPAMAEWLGVVPAHGRRLWEALGDELVAVRVDGRTAHLLADDLDALDDVAPPEGVRLLPPGDPALQKPARELLVPDAAVRKRLFRPVASPGAVLRDGRIVGLWRTRVAGRRLRIEVEPVDRRCTARAVGEEAERIARLRGRELGELAVG